jgi:8-oxo-dGTP pyrophosphatase MutT (NUDIX family)
MRRDFTASAFIIDSQKRVLLIWHHKFQKWMPPGGHLDPNELPEDGAKRECKEETGIDVEILGEPQRDIFAGFPQEGRVLKKPFMLLLEEIPAYAPKNQEAHQHIDFVYMAKPVDETQALQLQEAEGGDLRWFTLDELKALPDDHLFSNIRISSQSILESL